MSYTLASRAVNRVKYGSRRTDEDSWHIHNMKEKSQSWEENGTKLGIPLALDRDKTSVTGED